jgi:hypothetical protein
MKISKLTKETSQSLVYRFTRAIKSSGVLIEARKRKFRNRVKSNNLLKRAAVARIQKKAEYNKMKKLGKI